MEQDEFICIIRYYRSLFTKAYHPNLNDPASEMTYQNEERKEQNREKNNPE